MSLFIASLNSGSNGNCYYIGNEHYAVLVDAGISCRETERRMGRLGLSMQKVKAVFISHEHSDHISGLTVLSKKYKLPVYITPATLTSSRLSLEHALVRSFKAYEPVVIGELSISAFPKFHDAAHAHSFNITDGDVTIGVFTDIGMACKHLVEHFGKCHAAFLETNYDEEMLENGRYPFHLKRRIRGGLGHLSNAQALEVFTSHRPDFMSHLLLSHLSRDNNDPEMVYELFKKHANGTEIVVASRYVETSVYHINSSPVIVQHPVKVAIAQTQFSLF
ncbi:MAG: MBL fold metallo-hydrolase [Sphingobacteriales bacterium]